MNLQNPSCAVSLNGRQNSKDHHAARCLAACAKLNPPVCPLSRLRSVWQCKGSIVQQGRGGEEDRSC